MKYLKNSDLIYINRKVLEFTGEKGSSILYPEVLSIISDEPKQVLFGHELYPNIWLKAAFILQKTTKKHIFADGNKRTAFVAAKLFLMKNGYHLRLTVKQGIALMLSATINDDSQEEMLKIAKILENHSKKEG